MCPQFHVWPPGCYIHPILYFKNVPLLVFFYPLLRNPDDGLDSTTVLDAGMQRQDKAYVYVASCL